jgi:hypothetical protein
MIIGDAHDQPAFALHQVLHIAPHLITRSVCSLAPLLRGEGWGEGLFRPANAECAANAVPGPSPEIRAEFIIGRRFAPTRWHEFRPLPAKGGARLK